MHVKVGDIIIEKPDLEYVIELGLGSSGFEFKGLSIEEKGKGIVDALNAARGGELLECEAYTKEGTLLSGHGKLEIFDYQVSEEAPAKYYFSGTVILER